MLSLKALSCLLDYPDAGLVASRRELIDCFRQDSVLTEDSKAALIELVDQICAQDLLDAQEDYTNLFDRGRSCSLLLFEHVHGESRDRGQAMVDLMNIYQEQGFYIDAKELPDYLPLFLEYLSSRSIAEVRQWLGDVSHILALLGERLKQRDSHYAAVTEALLELAQVQVNQPELAQTVSQEERDDTPEALDKIWEEEMIRFGQGSAQDCGSHSAIRQRRAEVEGVMPVKILDAAASSNLGQVGS
ncbi:nitrate reductase molybdenum cofactor assembly chaperone [Balneatrix alpica]|uniref:nitrate reductase molybdenum cofactor assembly chaperone n=1 Tax=Balneatrix alpica TaxID=75684 RepID=UPI002738780E|nr:nitrate reductase molybdenum cofactor assembly chaperone [Balneatrix alpica]